MVQVYLDCGLFYLANEKCSQVAIRNLCDTRYDLISETSAMWKRSPWNWKLPVSLGKWCYWRPLKGLILRNCALQYDSMAQRRDGLKDPPFLPPTLSWETGAVCSIFYSWNCRRKVIHPHSILHSSQPPFSMTHLDFHIPNP